MTIRIKRPFTDSLIIILILLVVLAVFLCGDRYALTKMYITSATPDQIANAMQLDEFYSTYGETTLIVQGTVASVSRQNSETLIQFKTNSSYGAFCNTFDTSFTGNVGDSITILAEGSGAKREPNAVLLTNCVIVTAEYFQTNK